MCGSAYGPTPRAVGPFPGPSGGEDHRPPGRPVETGSRAGGGSPSAYLTRQSSGVTCCSTFTGVAPEIFLEISTSGLV